MAQDTLRLSREQCEGIFLRENLLLMAEKLEIPQAEAMVLQARLWPNPSIEVDEVNLWATQKQLSVFGEELKGFGNSNFGRNQQISLSVEQLILTAGKRKKLVALESVSVDRSRQYFEEVLRNLKLELRQQLTNLQYLQQTRSMYQNQLLSVQHLTAAYQKQVDRGYVPKGEYVRLKALEMEMAKNIKDLNNELNAAQKELKLLMHLPAHVQLEILHDGYTKNINTIEQLALSDLIAATKENRPDYKLSQLDSDYYHKLFAYEKAQRVPNLTIKGGYDRGGNFMYNFVGFGVALDLPFFNRNQGNIRSAQISIQQSQIRQQQMMLTLEQETALAYKNLATVVAFVKNIEPGYESTLDELLAGYTKAFSSRNISLLEYLDFLDAYLENKKIIMEATKEVNEKAEELNYIIGKDLIK